MEFSSEPEPGFLANSSRFVVFGTSARSVFPLPNTLAMVSLNASLIEPWPSEIMFMFTTITPPGFRCSLTMVKNSVELIWKGMVMS